MKENLWSIYIDEDEIETARMTLTKAKRRAAELRVYADSTIVLDCTIGVFKQDSKNKRWNLIYSQNGDLVRNP